MAAQHRRLEELVNEGDLDTLFELVTLDDAAIAWCSYSDRDHDPNVDEDDPDWWAINLFFAGEMSQRPALYRTVLLKLVEHASDRALANIGAGPLENFVSDDSDDLAWLEEQCQGNERLRIALSGVWCARYVSEETLLRLDRMAGVELARPLPREQWPPELIAHEEAEARLVALAGERWYEQVLQGDVSDELKAAMLDYLSALEDGHPDRTFLIEECHLDELE